MTDNRRLNRNRFRRKSRAPETRWTSGKCVKDNQNGSPEHTAALRRRKTAGPEQIDFVLKRREANQPQLRHSPLPLCIASCGLSENDCRQLERYNIGSGRCISLGRLESQSCLPQSSAHSGRQAERTPNSTPARFAPQIVAVTLTV